MGSQIDDINSKAPELELLPDASSGALVLTHPTDKEKRHTWTRNHREWGGPLGLEKYLKREPYLTTIPLARDGGITHWILSTTTSAGSDPKQQQQRPVLASCETIRKRVLVARPGPASGGDGGDGAAVVEEATGYGIGSVYTYQEYRGRSYAARMLRELGETLRTRPRAEPSNSANGDGDGERGGEAVCSALWSDIGKVFYAKKGWVPP
ncbi:hypothetical protein DL769_011455 [Monosporascus sp. CRB-8-3]|nr:hypothetical protein DL769_011455 [Monosporascus sp. CRB-8-3]